MQSDSRVILMYLDIAQTDPCRRIWYTILPDAWRRCSVRRQGRGPGHGGSGYSYCLHCSSLECARWRHETPEAAFEKYLGAIHAKMGACKPPAKPGNYFANSNQSGT